MGKHNAITIFTTTTIFPSSYNIPFRYFTKGKSKSMQRVEVNGIIIIGMGRTHEWINYDRLVFCCMPKIKQNLCFELCVVFCIAYFSSNKVVV
jgi:hypothetical protein